jgi:hypothetical protein
MKYKLVVTGLTAVTLVAVTACGESITGQAKSAPDTTTTSTNTSGATSKTSSSMTSSSLRSIDPCSLLTSGEAAELGTSGESYPEKIGSVQACTWHLNDGSFSVGARTNVGLSGAQPNGGELKDIRVGHHDARQLLDITGSCGIFIGVTSSSRVDVVLNAGGRDDPCPPALQVAELVEPKLP